MNIRTCAALLLAVGLPTAVFAVDTLETEPNETKAQALVNGVITLAAGDSVSGNSTGTSTTTAGAASADTFLIKTTPAALGIYRHRMVITTAGTAGHVGTIRGLTSGSTGATANTDATLQTSASSTTPSRFNQWYGFGREEQLYLRIAGTATTTSNYTATLSTDVVVPTAFGTSPEAGSMTIFHNVATNTAYDRDMFLFDSNFNPIAGIDDADSVALSVNLTPGTYYIGYGRFNTAVGTTAGSSIIQGSFQTGPVLDFNDIVTSSSSVNGTQPVTIDITHVAGVSSSVGPVLAPYDVAWFSFNVVTPTSPTNPSGVGAASPTSVVNDGTGVTTLSVTVTPGANPTSTFLTTGSVTVNGASIGAGTVTLLDNGVGADLVAGDNIFSATATVANGTPAGAATLPFTITDDQARIGTGNIALTVTTPPPACPAGLATLSFTNVQGDGAVGDPDNSIVTGNFGFAGNINVVRMSGRMNSNALFNTEARVRATAPDGSFYDFQPFTAGPSVSPRDLVSITFTLPALEAGTGTWSFEFFESFNDGATPDVVWSSVCFSVDQAATTLAATDTASSPVVRDGVATSTLAVTVAPAAFPDSTGIAVVVDASSVGGSGTLTLLDDGVAPDAVAGDNIFTGLTTVAYTTALGAATLPYTVTDAEGGNFVGSLNFTVSEANGACCLTDGSCTVTTIGNCLDVLGGTFAGTGTVCGTPAPLTAEGAGLFEDIAATGAPVVFSETDDAVATVTLPFTFNYFGTDFTSINVVTNGFAQFTGTSTAFSNGTLPSAGVPNNALYPLWDDFNLFGGGTVVTELLGTIGVDARFIIQWNAGQYNGFDTAPTDLSIFQIALFEDGSFEFRYDAVSAEGGTAGALDTTTIGYENATGTVAFQSAETRTTLEFATPISFRASSTLVDSGVCGPTCPPCAADYDGNGGVDGGDLAAFFTDFEAGETCADVDGNGGVDGGDLAFFFNVFELGGCE